MELTNKLYQLREEKKILDEQLSALKEQIETVEADIIAWMEANGLEQIKDKNGTTYLKPDVYARITDEATAFAWLQENGHGDIIKQTVHNRTLTSLVKECGEFPGVQAHYETKIAVRSI